jgi:hypothetical protein
MPLSFGRRPLLAALPLAPLVAGAAQAQGDPLKTKRDTFTIKNFKLIATENLQTVFLLRIV